MRGMETSGHAAQRPQKVAPSALPSRWGWELVAKSWGIEPHTGGVIPADAMSIHA